MNHISENEHEQLPQVHNEQIPWYERAFEYILWNNRLWVLLAVITGLVASIALFIIGSFDAADVVSKMWRYYVLADHSLNIHETAVSEIIGAIDLFLIAIVLLIFSFGIYELFVSQIDVAQGHNSSRILEIHSLDELKDKIAKVIIMVLIVKYFQMVLGMEFNGALEMLYLSASILGLSLALFFLHKGGEHK